MSSPERLQANVSKRLNFNIDMNFVKDLKGATGKVEVSTAVPKILSYNQSTVSCEMIDTVHHN